MRIPIVGNRIQEGESLQRSKTVAETYARVETIRKSGNRSTYEKEFEEHLWIRKAIE